MVSPNYSINIFWILFVQDNCAAINEAQKTINNNELKSIAGLGRSPKHLLHQIKQKTDAIFDSVRFVFK
jgi:hypothetical protein